MVACVSAEKNKGIFSRACETAKMILSVTRSFEQIETCIPEVINSVKATDSEIAGREIDLTYRLSFERTVKEKSLWVCWIVRHVLGFEART